MAKKFINEAIQHPGRLHELLGKPPDEPLTDKDFVKLHKIEAKSPSRSLASAIALGERFHKGSLGGKHSKK